MTFKDQVAADNLTVFINPDEFGEMIEFSVPGFPPQELMAVVDWDENAAPLYTYAEGTYSSRVTLFMRESDLGYRPEENQEVFFAISGHERYPYIIARVYANMGILEVRIEGNRT